MLDLRQAEDIEMRLDSEAVEQAILNLLDNALKYARPHSEVTITGSLGGGTASPRPSRSAAAARSARGRAMRRMRVPEERKKEGYGRWRITF